jgi:hypothetical protein
MTRFLESFLAFLLLSVLVAASESALADDFLGGPGGSNFGTINCPDGMAVIGLGGRAGAVIDTMQLLCGKANGNDNGPLDPRRIGPSNGGGAVSAVCPPLSAAISIQVDAKEWRRHVVVSQVTLTCALVGVRTSTSRAVLGGGGGDNYGSRGCADTDFIAGFTGRAGDWVDALGISTCLNESALR